MIFLERAVLNFHENLLYCLKCHFLTKRLVKTFFIVALILQTQWILI